MTSTPEPRQRLLLFIAPAGHPHRDAACATLAWLAPAEGALFECYFEARATGVHYGGGHPGHADPADLRGGTFAAGHHLEQLYLLLARFDCQVASLGPTLFDPSFAEAGVRVRTRSGDIATFYEELFAGSAVAIPDSVVVVGDGGRPQGVALGAYSFPEVVNRRLLAVAAGDATTLLDGRKVEYLWDPSAPEGAATIKSPSELLVSVQTRWMAERWASSSNGYMLGDPELAGRWAPAASRHGWLPIFGVPQSRLIHELGDELSAQKTVFGRQQDDRDFLVLSRAGVAFQLIDPGRPPFPAVEGRECAALDLPHIDGDPHDAQLEKWATEGRVLSTLLFWTGMVRELESLYALTDVFSLSGLHAGIVLTSASFEYMPRPPLTLAYTPQEQGGLAPRIEVLIASGGIGAFLESETPVARFKEALLEGVERVSGMVGPTNSPRGWWGTMDAPFVPVGRTSRFERRADAPFVRLRYGRAGDLDSVPLETTGGSAGQQQRSVRRLRRLVRDGPLGALFEPLHPFDGYRPGAPGKGVLEAVHDAGFEYAFTKSAFGEEPSIVSGVGDLTAINYTVGRWDGWTPFATINSLADLRQAERRLLRSGKPGWLVGTLDTCLWAFSGPLWERAPRLRAMCDWMAAGGSSGRLVNVTPRAVARYARVLASRGLVRKIEAR